MIVTEQLRVDSCVLLLQCVLCFLTMKNSHLVLPKGSLGFQKDFGTLPVPMSHVREGSTPVKGCRFAIECSSI